MAAAPRARDLGVPFEGTPGPLNAITDVAGVLVGHTTLRVRTMSELDRPANVAEIEAMRSLLAQALDEGALGLSTGT
ncbi:MAG: hypothetical protein NTZ79_15925, partial [Proteobacteria bacterium]|nr:hypothetical protein [Pseudomonadota bacterium]